MSSIWFWSGLILAIIGGVVQDGWRGVSTWACAYISLNALLYSMGVPR